MPVCSACGETRGLLELRDGVCRTCRDAELDRGRKEAIANERKRLDGNRAADVSEEAVFEASQSIKLTTAFEIPNREICEIVEIVGAEVAIGMNIFKDIANAWRDTFGGRSNTVQNALRDARTQCLLELRREAFRIGADAVIAVRFCYSEASVAAGTGGGILFVSVTGTAVSLADWPRRLASTSSTSGAI